MSRSPEPRRRGRRPAGSDARADILAAARTEFAAQGYDATSLRGVARRAGVDPALVHHYFDDKSALFAAAQDLPISPASAAEVLLAGPAPELGERIVRFFLATWDAPEGRERIVALLRSASTHEDAARTLREFLAREVFGRVVTALGADQPDVRGALVASQLLGLAMARYVLRMPAVADAPAEDLVVWLAPSVQRYLTA
ncbi:MAG: TetR/AcrR family transcriptional regulator [Angustibacter sp.]